MTSFAIFRQVNQAKYKGGRVTRSRHEASLVAMSPRCRRWRRSCSTAYIKRGCRCPDCTRWRRAQPDHQNRKVSKVAVSLSRRGTGRPATGRARASGPRLSSCTCPRCGTVWMATAQAVICLGCGAPGRVVASTRQAALPGVALAPYREQRTPVVTPSSRRHRNPRRWPPASSTWMMPCCD